jgi:hypothetical protein
LGHDWAGEDIAPLGGDRVFNGSYYYGSITTIVTAIILFFAAVAIFIVTATSARKAGAGSGMVWGGGILMTLFLLSSPTQIVLYWLIEALPYNSGLNALQQVLFVLSMALPVIYAAVGVPILIRAAVKAARGPQVMPLAQPSQPYGYGPVGGYPQQPAPPAPPAPGMAPPPPRSF